MDKSETAKNGPKSIIAVSVHSTPENAVTSVHEEKVSASMRESKPPTEAVGEDDMDFTAVEP